MNPANLSYKLQIILGTLSLLTKAQTATRHFVKPNEAILILTDVYDFLYHQNERGG
jgi:hypothetical protein